MAKDLLEHIDFKASFSDSFTAIKVCWPGTLVALLRFTLPCHHGNSQALECLNEHPSHTSSNALKQGYREDDLLVLQSDTDEQLCVNIHFHQKVKLQVSLLQAYEHTVRSLLSDT